MGTRLINPTWDPDGSIDRAERARPGGATNADREILAIPVAKGSRCYFPAGAIARALLLTAPDNQAEEVGAGVDFGLSAGGDHSALSIAARYPNGIFAALVALEIAGGSGQKGRDTYKAFARRLLDHGCDSVAADVHYKESFKEELDANGVQFIDGASKDRGYAGTKSLLVEERLALGDLDAVTREAMADQLGSIVSTPLSAGRIKITAPRRKVADMGVGGTTRRGDVRGHSLRAGFASSAARASKADLDNMRQTGHRSRAMLGRYVRAAQLRIDNPGSGLLQLPQLPVLSGYYRIFHICQPWGRRACA